MGHHNWILHQAEHSTKEYGKYAPMAKFFSFWAKFDLKMRRHCTVSVGNSVSVHQRNLQLLLTEIYKTVNNLNPSFMAEVFVTKDVPYNLCGINNLALPRARTNLYGIDTIRFVGQKLW